MVITHFGGTEICNDIETVCSVLSKRYGNNSNEYWIHLIEKYPCIGILVKDNLAYVQYFPNEGNAGFSSISSDANLKSDENTVFYTNTIYEEIEINNNSLIPFDMAVKVVIEFFKSPQLPGCIEWFEF